MWNKTFTHQEFHRHSRYQFYIPISDLPPPNITFKPEKEMLVILNAHKLHAIAESKDCERTALSCFLGFRGEKEKLTIWS